MIEQLRKKLTVFLSSVITMILATMSILLFYAVVQEYSNSTYASYSQDTNLLYSYLNQTNIIDMNILNEYNTKNLIYCEMIKRSYRQRLSKKVKPSFSPHRLICSLNIGMTITVP